MKKNLKSSQRKKMKQVEKTKIEMTVGQLHRKSEDGGMTCLKHRQTKMKISLQLKKIR